MLTLKQTQRENGNVMRTRSIENDVRSQPQTPIPPSSSSTVDNKDTWVASTNMLLTQNWYLPGSLVGGCERWFTVSLGYQRWSPWICFSTYAQHHLNFYLKLNWMNSSFLLFSALCIIRTWFCSYFKQQWLKLNYNIWYGDF